MAKLHGKVLKAYVWNVPPKKTDGAPWSYGCVVVLADRLEDAWTLLKADIGFKALDSQTRSKVLNSAPQVLNGRGVFTLINL